MIALIDVFQFNFMFYLIGFLKLLFHCYRKSNSPQFALALESKPGMFVFMTKSLNLYALSDEIVDMKYIMLKIK